MVGLFVYSSASTHINDKEGTRRRQARHTPLLPPPHHQGPTTHTRARAHRRPRPLQTWRQGRRAGHGPRPRHPPSLSMRCANSGRSTASRTKGWVGLRLLSCDAEDLLFGWMHTNKHTRRRSRSRRRGTTTSPMRSRQSEPAGRRRTTPPSDTAATTIRQTGRRRVSETQRTLGLFVCMWEGDTGDVA